MAFMLARFESSGFLPVGHLNILVYAAPVDKEEIPARLSSTNPASLNRCGGP
jgi:hypothetical protein